MIARHLTAALASLTLMLSGCGLIGSESAEDHIKNAEAFIDGGQAKPAVAELKRALTLEPKNAQARWLLGELSLRLGDATSALKELRRAEEYGISPAATSHYIAKALITQGAFKDVLAIRIDPSWHATTRANLLADQALAAYKLDDKAKARSFVEEALAIAKNNIEALVFKAKLQADAGDLEQAMKTVEHCLSLAEDNADAWRFKAVLYAQQKQFEEAIAAYDRAIANTLNKTPDRLAKARLLTKTQKFSKAESILNQLKNQHPKNREINYLLGLIAYRRGDWATAETLLQLADGDSASLSTYMLALAHYQQGHIEQTKQLIRRFRSEFPTHINAMLLDANLALRQNKPQQAETILRSMTDKGYNGIAALRLLAYSVTAQGRLEDARSITKRVLQLNDQDAAMNNLMGRILSTQGDISAGEEYLQRAVVLAPEELSYRINLINALIEMGAPDKARATAKQYLASDASAHGYNLAAMVELRLGRTDEATQLLQQARALDKADLLSRLQLASLAINRKQYVEAEQYLQEVLTQHPGNAQALLRLALVHSKKGDLAAMQEALERAVASNPKLLTPRMMLAQYFAYENRFEDAKRVLDDAPAHANQTADYLWLAATVDTALGELNTARRHLDRLEQLKDSAKVRVLKARVEAGLSKLDQTETELRKALQISKDYLPAKLLLIELKLKQNDLSSAEQLLSTITDAPEQHRGAVLRLRGAFHARKGNLEAARKDYQKAYEMGQDRTSLLRLADILHRREQTGAAVKLLQEWLTNHDSDHSTRRTLAEYQASMGQTSNAADNYRRIVKESPKDIVALNNLAQLLAKSDPGEALRWAEQAYGAAPESDAVLDTYAMLLLDQGDKEKAQRMIDRAIAQRPQVSVLHYHRAVILSARNERPAALASLRKALSSSSNFPERAQALALQERLTSSE